MGRVFKALLFLLSFSLFSCKDDSTAPTTSDLQLTADDVAVTEAWLRLQIAPHLHTSPSRLTLIQDGIGIASIPDPPADTSFMISALAPKSNHTFQSKLQISSSQLVASDPLSITTLDTTSHEFSWHIDTLGDGASSVLNDVIIVNDSLAYAVGEIHKRDSLGNWENEPYGIAIWNGRTWQLRKLYYIPSGGGTKTVLSNIRGIAYLNSLEIWFAAGSLFRWDGASDEAQLMFSRLSLPNPNGSIEKLWGHSSSELIGVGNAGTIVTNVGGSWQALETGTNVDLYDVWGSPDGSVVWTCGYFTSQFGTYLLKGDKLGWGVAFDGTAYRLQLRTDSLSGALSSVYTNSSKRVAVVSPSGLYVAPASTQGEAERLSFTTTFFPGFPRGVRGNGLNDLVIAGDYMMVAHFNGLTWRYFSELRQTNEHLNAVAQKANIVIAVGEFPDAINGRGLVLRGRR